MASETPTRQIGTIFGTVLIVAATVAMLCYVGLTFRPTSRQLTNLEVAEQERPKVQALLDTEPRFRDVWAGVYTGQDGAVSLNGFVETEADLFLLMKLVAKERLPVAVAWHVRLRGEEP